MSTLGSSLINYGIASQGLFPLIRDFVVNYIFTFSPHTSIQVNFNVNYERNDCSEEHFGLNVFISLLQLYKHTNIYVKNRNYGIRTEAKSLLNSSPLPGEFIQIIADTCLQQQIYFNVKPKTTRSM